MNLPHYRVIVLLITELLQKEAENKNLSLLSWRVIKAVLDFRLLGLETNGGGFVIILDAHYQDYCVGFEYYKDGKVIEFSIKHKKVTKARVEALEDILDTLQAKLIL